MVLPIRLHFIDLRPAIYVFLLLTSGCTSSLDSMSATQGFRDQESSSDESTISLSSVLRIEFSGNPNSTLVSFSACIRKIILRENGHDLDVTPQDREISVSPKASTLLVSVPMDYLSSGKVYSELEIQFRRNRQRCPNLYDEAMILNNGQSIKSENTTKLHYRRFLLVADASTPSKTLRLPFPSAPHELGSVDDEEDMEDLLSRRRTAVVE